MREVYEDLAKSPLRFEYKNMVFVFSTPNRLNKFSDQFDNAIEETNNRLTLRYRVPIYIPEIAAIRLYRDIEPVLFLIYVDGKAVEKWQDLAINNAKVYARY